MPIHELSDTGIKRLQSKRIRRFSRYYPLRRYRPGSYVGTLVITRLWKALLNHRFLMKDHAEIWGSGKSEMSIK